MEPKGSGKTQKAFEVQVINHVTAGAAEGYKAALRNIP
jgi:hypothetical protein